MAFDNPRDDDIRQILHDARAPGAGVIAMVGASSNPSRPSNGVMSRLLRVGYRVIPVNPNEREVHGVPAVSSLSEIREPVDIVDVFRRSEFTPDIAKDAVKIGAKTLWLQQGVINEEAVHIAKAGGLNVVMDLCIAVELALLRPN